MGFEHLVLMGEMEATSSRFEERVVRQYQVGMEVRNPLGDGIQKDCRISGEIIRRSY